MKIDLNSIPSSYLVAIAGGIILLSGMIGVIKRKKVNNKSLLIFSVANVASGITILIICSLDILGIISPIP